MTRSAVVALLSIAVAGCMPQTLRWYQPLDSGEAIRYGCGVPADVMKFKLDERGSELRVSVNHPDDARNGQPPPGNKASLTYHFMIAPGSRILVSKAVLVLLAPGGNQIAEYPFKTLGAGFRMAADGYVSRRIPVTEELVFRSDMPSTGRYDQYIEHFSVGPLPAAFSIRYPDMVINGKHVPGPLVSYAESEDLFLRRNCWFGPDQ